MTHKPAGYKTLPALKAAYCSCGKRYTGRCIYSAILKVRIHIKNQEVMS